MNKTRKIVMVLAILWDDIVEIASLNTIAFNSYYKETLSLLYTPVFPTGLSSTEMDEAGNALK
jgi:hypothetical protein